MTRCRKDDLAVIVNDHEQPINNGGFVVVIGRASPGHYERPVDWDCRALQPLIDQNGTGAPAGSIFGFRDAELWPIRGKPKTDLTELIADLDAAHEAVDTLVGMLHGDSEPASKSC
jgi:hypothetical protein